MRRWLWLALVPSLALAQPPAPTPLDDDAARGRAVAAEAKARQSGFGDSAVAVTMILRNAEGRESLRELRLRTREIPDDGDQSLFIFDSPPDVAGTELLTHAHREREDDRWLYLPDLGRIKRIHSANQSGPFMGSEFAYEDLKSIELEKYSFLFLREDSYGGEPVLIYEQRPLERSSGYSRQVVTVDANDYRVLRVEHYDRKQTLLKTMTTHDFQLYDERWWKPLRVEMVNHQTDKSTTMRFRGYRFGVGLNPAEFEPANLGYAG